MIEAGQTYIFSKSGNQVRALEKSASHQGVPCWCVERVSGASAGKRMIVPERALISEEDWSHE